uniref:Rx_N domain-containing protein n=1 Tax=Panagrellus redivivus TaxID=6233 RepID=A0A7E4ZT57_PANRE
MRGNTNEQVPSTLKKAIKRLRLLRLFFRSTPKGGRKSILCELSRFTPSNQQLDKHIEGDVDHGLVTALYQLKEAAFLGCQQLNDRRKAKVLQKEWENVARGLDRIFMTSFAIFTKSS